MNCVGCPNRYVGKGWFCWSGNKKSLSKCDNGKPHKGRVIYKGMETKKIPVEVDEDIQSMGMPRM